MKPVICKYGYSPKTNDCCPIDYVFTTINRLQDIKKPDRNHAYVMPNNDVYILNYAGTKVIRIGSLGEYNPLFDDTGKGLTIKVNPNPSNPVLLLEVDAGEGIEFDSNGKLILSEKYRYKLPIASKTLLGGIKVGENLKIASDGTLSLDLDNVKKEVQSDWDAPPTDPRSVANKPFSKIENGLEVNDGNLSVKDYDSIVLHSSKRDNPHAVTVEQVGTYTKEKIDEKDTEFLAGAKNYSDEHARKTDNPHKVTAEQVGTYTKTQVDSKDSTTLTTAKAYTDNHANKKDNPHSVTAAQINAYTKTETDAKLKTKTNTDGYSNDIVTRYVGDLNDLQKSGTFMVYQAENAPSNGWWFVQSMKHNELYTTQVAWKLNDPNTKAFKIRSKVNNSWSEWSEVAMLDDLPDFEKGPLIFKNDEITTQNWNDLTDPGIYKLSNSTGDNRPPLQNLWGYVEVLKSGGGIVQVYWSDSSLMFMRVYTGSPAKWSEWKRAAMTSDFEDGPMIMSSERVIAQDWNTLTKAGVYIVASPSGSGSNKPTAAVWGMLEVNKNPNSTMITQTFNGVNPSMVYTRDYSSAGWGAWQRLARMSDLPSLGRGALIFSNTTLTTQDWNTITTSGIYYASNASGSNKPTNQTNYGYLTVYNYGGYIFQEFDSGFTKYFRSFSGDPAKWSVWERNTKGSEFEAGAIVNKSTAVTTQDWNTITAAGVYRVSSTTGSNRPLDTGSVYGYLEVNFNASGLVHQVFKRIEPNETYMRQFANNKWSSWQKLLTVSDFEKKIYLGYLTKKMSDSIDTYPLGTSVTFVRAEDGWPSYGVVTTTKSYSGGGGSMQIYQPYDDNHGGTRPRFRLAKYNNGNVKWGGWENFVTDSFLESKLSSKTNDDGYSNVNVSSYTGDLNNLKKSGTFMGSALGNAPQHSAVNGWWFVQVMKHNDKYVTQVAWVLNDGGTRSFWIRHMHDGVWKEWVKNVTADDLEKGSINQKNTVINTQDLNTITDAGVYNLNNASGANIPSELGTSAVWGFLEVFKLPGETYTTQKLTSTAKDGFPKEYIRAYAGNPPTWKAWHRLAKTIELEEGALFRKTKVIDQEDWNNITASGIYYVSSTTGRGANKPLTACFGYLTVIPHKDTPNLVQTFQHWDGISVRMKSATGWSSWRKIAFQDEVVNLTQPQSVSGAKNFLARPTYNGKRLAVAGDIEAINYGNHNYDGIQDGRIHLARFSDQVYCEINFQPDRTIYAGQTILVLPPRFQAAIPASTIVRHDAPRSDLSAGKTVTIEDDKLVANQDLEAGFWCTGSLTVIAKNGL
ncbi:hypothetical protein NRIC_04040 [Enterococcus florum]|uniref:Uncharacterized protein n=1 Tax=Enterococcus florum TaxID=2480627 RepID=A0A4P5PG92_9ENTE|nr:pyocin knob domain-containing protein [Enterococcus florum]GCF92513.1 hypothetical protein NRIC_04040 [Enterococcus florum]